LSDFRVAKFTHFRDKPDELEAFVIRLNAELVKERRIRDGVDIRHAYINDDLLARYEKRRRLEVPSERITTEMYNIRKHVIGFFVNRLSLQSPQDWFRVHRDEWAEYLLTDTCAPKAPASLREIIQAANRFVKYLRELRPSEIPFPLVFEPISKERFKTMTAEREIDPKIKKRKLILANHLELILKSCPPELLPFVELGYRYGARRGEALGFLPGDVKNKGGLCIHRQLATLEPEMTFKPTKGKMKRQVPHWNATAAEAYLWVEAVQKYRVDADELTQKWKELMAPFKFDYDFHDLRHTFITRAMRTQHHRDVMLAAGHKHLKTTMGYAHDDRELEDDTFRPTG
jgi:integrase